MALQHEFQQLLSYLTVQTSELRSQDQEKEERRHYIYERCLHK